MSTATCSASPPTPATNAESGRLRHSIPRNYKPGLAVTPRLCSRAPVSSRTRTSIQLKSKRNPVHQMMFVIPTARRSTSEIGSCFSRRRGSRLAHPRVHRAAPGVRIRQRGSGRDPATDTPFSAVLCTKANARQTRRRHNDYLAAERLRPRCGHRSPLAILQPSVPKKRSHGSSPWATRVVCSR